MTSSGSRGENVVELSLEYVGGTGRGRGIRWCVRAWAAAALLCVPAFAQEWQSFPLRDNGSIPVWLVAGPFPNGSPYKHGPGCFGYFTDYLAASGGETGCEPTDGEMVAHGDIQEAPWKIAFSDPAGQLDYIELLGVDKGTPGVVYAFCRIVSPTAQPALALVRSNDGVRVWHDGRLVHELHRGRGVDEGEADRVPLELRQGPNTLLVKVDQSAGGWGQRIVLKDASGNPLEGVTAEIRTRKPLRGKIWSATLASTDVVARKPDGPRQMLLAQVVSGGLEGVECRLTKPGWPAPQVFILGDLPVGEHRIEMLVPPLVEDGPAQAVFEAATDRVELADTPLQKPREWTIDLVQHTHTDFGYTRPQDELMPDFLRHIDFALDYCDQTDDYPEEARFRWTCEASWTVREFLRRRPPEQIERLRRRVAEGRIEITGLFANLLEVADENVMAASLDPVREIRAAGLPVTAAMQDDVPGAAWCLTDYLPDMGIHYLVMGVNNDLTPRPFFRPTAFWWESPSGNRLLAWRPDHYHTANNLRIHQGDRDVFKGRLLEYLASIASNGYPFDAIAMQYSGLQIDNSPPALTGCEMIRRWNEAYAWPRLRSATVGEFPARVAAEHGDELEVYRGAWPNWWTNGHAFTFAETAEARRTHSSLNVTQGLFAMAALLGETLPQAAADQTRKLQDDLLFFDEHTFGAQENFTDPGAENSVVQWGEKMAHLWDAVQDSALLRESAWGALESHIRKETVPAVAVVNALSWARSGAVDVYIGHELVDPADAPRFIDAATGAAVPAQVMRSRFEGSYWTLWVDDVPALGAKVLRVERGESDVVEAGGGTTSGTMLENDFYRVVADAETGSLSSVVDKETGRELVDPASPWDLGQVIFDHLRDSHFSDHASYLERATRSSVRDVSVSVEGPGPLWRSLRITASADDFITTDTQPGLVLEVRLYEHAKLLELHYTANKKYVPEPNSMYVAFPFASGDGQFTYDAQGGLVTPGTNQLPGSSTDWQTVQSFVALQDAGGQILLSSDEIPLVQFGEINMGKWQYVCEVDRPHVFSWVINDYWTSGFRGTKESVFQWSYALTSTADRANSTATRFGQAWRTPLAARVFPPADAAGRAAVFSTLRIAPDNILLVNARPARDGGGIVLHVRETDGQKTAIAIDGLPWNSYRIERVNVLEELLETVEGNPVLEPFESAFLLLALPATALDAPDAGIPPFYVPGNPEYTVVDSARDSIRFTLERTLKEDEKGHLVSASSFVNPNGEPMGWHEFGTLEGPGWAANAIGGAYEIYRLSAFFGKEEWREKALRILDHVLDCGFIDEETGFIRGYRHTTDGEFYLNYRHESDWFCPGSMAKNAFQLLQFADELGGDPRAERMRGIAVRCAAWIHANVAPVPNGWFPRRCAPAGSVFKTHPDGKSEDLLWQTSADGLFIVQLQADLTRRGLADYRKAVADKVAVFIDARGFFGSINHDTYDTRECVAYAVAFRTLLAAAKLLEDESIRQFAYGRCLNGLEQFRMREDRNGVATTGLLIMERSWDTAYLWENAEAALAYFEAARDIQAESPEGSRQYALDGLTLLRAIARHHYGPHGFLTEGVDWNNAVGENHHIEGRRFGAIQYTEPFLNNQHICEPTLFYLEHLAGRAAAADGAAEWRDAEDNIILKRPRP